jgi:Uma2 family endonuclease
MESAQPRERFTELGHTRAPFRIANRWFVGEAELTTFDLDELLATKLRALYQQKKGPRDETIHEVLTVDGCHTELPTTEKGAPSRFTRPFDCTVPMWCISWRPGADTPMHPHIEAGPRIAIDLSGVGITDEIFARICRDNPELGFELTASGELVVVTPTGSQSGHRELRILQRLGEWTDRDGTGIAFSSNALFTLPNGAKRAPDAAWILRDRWERLSPEVQEGFAPIAPDFVVELRSPTDRIADLHEKMREYAVNGVRLGWLLDPFGGEAWVYRPDTDPEHVPNPEWLDGGDVLPGFRFDFSEIAEAE